MIAPAGRVPEQNSVLLGVPPLDPPPPTDPPDATENEIV